MFIAIQSTIRRFHGPMALAVVCATLSACSKQNKNDWFHFGQETPPVDTQGEESPPIQAAPQAVQLPAVPPPISSVDDQEPIADVDPVHQVQEPDVEEVVQLYRRLHVETDQSARSELIVEILSDPRERVRLLGFDLASRDLSAGATLSPDAANAAISLLSNPLPSIRTSAARLITRLALPDAMVLLTDALSTELDPIVAESLLRGIERWPNPQARTDVLRWYQASGAVRDAAANAAWGLAELDLWVNESDTLVLQSVYRSIPDTELTDADRKLIAVTGSNADIDRLISLARDPSNPTRINAANALIFSPRGVDPLIDLASINPDFSPAAADAIENHRLNPEGIHRLAALKWTDDQARIESLVHACSRLDHEQLSDAIRLARIDNSIDDELSIRLLSPLVAGHQILSPRTAPGVILLAELEINNQRPDRSIEILSLLPSTGVDPASTLRATHILATAHILLAEFDQAAELSLNPETWIGALVIFDNQAARPAIARQILDRAIELSSDQQAVVDEALSASPSTPDEDLGSSSEQP